MDAWRYGIYLLVFTFDISLVRYRCEHSKINSISPRDHVLFSIYTIQGVFAYVEFDSNFLNNFLNDFQLTKSALGASKVICR